MSWIKCTIFVVSVIFLSYASFAEPATCIPRSMGEKWEQRFAVIRERNKEKTPDIVFFGESLFLTWNLRPEFSPIFKKHFAEMKIVNFCGLGEWPQTLLWKLSNGNALQDIKPGLIVLNIGGDNRDPATDTVAGIKNLVAVMNRQSPDAKILLIPPMRRGREGGGYWRRSQEVADGMEGLADGKATFFLDLEKALSGKSGKRRPELFEKNSFSFNAAGYEETGKILARTLRDILGK